MNKIILTIFIFAFALNSTLFGANDASSSELSQETEDGSEVSEEEIKTQLKTEIHSFLKKFVPRTPKEEFEPLPRGIEIIEGNNYRGVKLSVGRAIVDVDLWTEDIGLLERHNKCRELNERLILSVNGAFYSSRGVLAPVIKKGKIPGIPRQYPGSLPRCFFATFRGIKGNQFWFIGETTVSASILCKNIFDNVWFNGDSSASTWIENLLGGGGWIIRDRKDVHHESVDRQRFIFRPEDRRARHTVIAQDSDRHIYFIVFESGLTLYNIAYELLKKPEFSKVEDAFFVDGGASSCIVMKGKYLVAPLYMVDKARFSAFNVYLDNRVWNGL